jgi:hypothetical protein
MCCHNTLTTVDVPASDAVMREHPHLDMVNCLFAAVPCAAATAAAAAAPPEGSRASSSAPHQVGTAEVTHAACSFLLRLLSSDPNNTQLLEHSLPAGFV